MTLTASPHDIELDELQTFLADWGEPAFRATQIWEGLYRHAGETYESMSNLPQLLRQRLAERLPLPELEPKIDQLSSDGWTRKVLFELSDETKIETVLMRYDKRRTVCISTQAGCAMGCPFCATGQGGLKRNLTVGEIVAQVLFFERALRQEPKARTDSPHQLTNIVFMGMGEPFANYRATIASLRRLIDPQGLDFGARRITVSTVGLIPAIEKFSTDGGQVNLAVSVHAGTDELRDQLVPINRKFPLRDLVAACHAYVKATGRRLSFEWALIDDVNDSPEQARAFARLVKDLPANLIHVNLIPLNPTSGYEGHASQRERVTEFCAELDKAGIPNSVRIRRGIDIAAGCGQLVEG